MPEAILAWLAVAAVAAALTTAWRGHERATRNVLWTAAVLAMAAAVVRVAATGHLPKFGTFEESLGTAATVLLLTAWIARIPGRSTPAAVAAGVAGLLLVHGSFFPLTRYPLTISELSFWLDLHVFSAWLAAAAFALVVGGCVWLWRGGAGPAERFLHRSLQVGFVFHTLLMVLGAIYSAMLFGRAFSFDPIEILAIIAWLVTASVLHLRLYRGLRGARFAALGLVAALILFFSFRVIVHLSPVSTYHVIDLDLRIHR